MTTDRSLRRPVGLWLLAMAAAVVVQVVLGGITRLTDSGLSITEWKPLLGVVPPLDEASWQEAFAKYQQIPQFKLLKTHLTLPEFKFIYFWEWFHRLWGRLLGVFFVVPFLVFWRQGRTRGLERRLVFLFVMGGLQGLLGWVMVASGLTDLVYVSHLRLAAHFILAVLLLAALLWTGLDLLVAPESRGGDATLRKATGGLVAAVLVQHTWGAFMAGLKGALAAPTWPSINGMWFPGSLTENLAWWNDSIAVHFVHRNLAYALVVAIGVWWWKARALAPGLRHGVAALVVVQVVLGILTVLNAFVAGRLLWFGVAHQLVGTVLLAGMVAAWHRLTAAEPAPSAVDGGHPSPTPSAV